MVSLSDSRAISPLVYLEAAAFSVFAFGHQAVVFFFVLSGFCIHFRQAEKLHDVKTYGDRFDFRTGHYLLRRLRRILPAYYFALLLTALLDWVVRAVNPQILSQMPQNSIVNIMLIQHNSPSTLFGNLLFLQWLHYPTFGNDTPLWSLAYEFFLYLLYPAFLWLRVRSGAWCSIGIVFLVSALGIVLSGRTSVNIWLLPVFAYWFCWCVGALVAEAYVGLVSLPSFLKSLPVLLLAAGVWLASVRALPTMVSDTLGAVVCASLLLFVLTRLVQHKGASPEMRLLNSAMPLGRFSYSLYLTHVPVLGLICALWLLFYGTLPTTPALFLLGVVAAVAAGWVSYVLVERRFLSPQMR